MSRSRTSTPADLPHKKSGQARVRIPAGSRYRDIYLGPYGSPESWEKYHRVLAEYYAGGQVPARFAVSVEGGLTIAELLVQYQEAMWDRCHKNGKPTQEWHQIARYAKSLVHVCGSLLAQEFGPKKFIAVRNHVAWTGNLETAVLDHSGRVTKPGKPLGRGYVNNLMKAVIRMFRWVVVEELLPASVHEALTKIGGIRKGSDPRLIETLPIKPVPSEHIAPVVACAIPQIATMIQVQRLTGMRPDEVTIIRPCDIDRTGEVWSYRPSAHKLENHELDREILIGPQAQELLLPWLGRKQPDEYLFSPREVAEANARELEKRRKRPSSKRVQTNKTRPPRDHYDDRSYRQAVLRYCERAGVSAWTPGQLRHNAGTEVRAQFGAEAAQLVLGHHNLSTTEIYAEKDRVRYLEIMRQIG